MSFPRYSTTTVAVLIIVSIIYTANAGDKSDEEAKKIPQAAQLVKIGRYHINTQHIKYTLLEPERLIIVFHEGKEGFISLRGNEKVAMSKWLDSHSLTINTLLSHGFQEQIELPNALDMLFPKEKQMYK